MPTTSAHHAGLWLSLVLLAGCASPTPPEAPVTLRRAFDLAQHEIDRRKPERHVSYGPDNVREYGFGWLFFPVAVRDANLPDLDESLVGAPLIAVEHDGTVRALPAYAVLRGQEERLEKDLKECDGSKSYAIDGITIDQARVIAQQKLDNATRDHDLTIDRECTYEYRPGWVFSVGPRRFFETGDFREMQIGGYGPLFVGRDGTAQFIPSYDLQPTKESADTFIKSIEK